MSVTIEGIAHSVVITSVVAPVGGQVGAVTELTLVAGDSLALRATALDARGFALGNVPFAWTSQAPGVASVSSAGVVRAVAPGSAVVSAATGEVSAAVTVSVTEAPGAPAQAAYRASDG